MAEGVQRLAHMGAPEWRLGALDPLAPKAPTCHRRGYSAEFKARG
jgi:hypothetical protein